MSNSLGIPRTEATIVLSGADFKIIADWLSGHERDIGEHLDDYQDLTPLYVAVFGKTPRKYT